MEFRVPDHEYRAPTDGSFRRADFSTAPRNAVDPDKAKKKLGKIVRRLDKLQRILYAQDRYSVLCVFQAMDAAGKDSTIRAVTRGLNPAGFQVFSFKAPSKRELDHDFLWRTSRSLPERGRIGVFNRSYYEEVLVVRVHPEYLSGQRLPELGSLEELWSARYESIRDHEKHLTRNGTVILKFWLNVSSQEQRRRFLDRIDDPNKNWKFSAADLEERARWADYMQAYEEAVRATSTTWAPWYVIPADDKPFMRLTVSRILEQTLTGLDMQYPTLDDETIEAVDRCRAQLEAEDAGAR